MRPGTSGDINVDRSMAWCSTRANYEACIGVLGIQDICHFTSRDIGYYPFYFQGYGILVTFRDIEYLRKLIMGIFATL